MSERAVSEVVSYVLVFSLVVSAVGIVSVSGLSTLQDVRNDEQLDNAEKAFSVLSDNIADIHRRNAPSRATEINLGEAKLETGENVTMSVSVNSTSEANWTKGWELRPLVYTGDEDRQLVYEAGAVFRYTTGGSIGVQDPPFVVGENRTLISVVGLNRPDRQALSGSTVLIRTRQQRTEVNPTSDVVNISVGLEDTSHPDLWAEYFLSAGFDDCPTVSAATGTVECYFAPDSPIEQTYVVYHDIAVSIDS